MEFSYAQTENFEMEKLSSDTGYFKKPVEINKGLLGARNQKVFTERKYSHMSGCHIANTMD